MLQQVQRVVDLRDPVSKLGATRHEIESLAKRCGFSPVARAANAIAS